MIRKTALLATVATLFIAAPALAQEEPAEAMTTPAEATAPAMPETAAPAATPAPQAALSLTAGSNVTSSDGIVLGQLQGAQTNASGDQELTVKGTDGQIRAVPLNGLRQEGEGVVVGWSQAEFKAATPMTPDASDNASNVAGEADEPTAAPTTPSDPAAEPSTPDMSTSTTPETSDEPMTEEPQS
ncbi:hypothetical protein ASG17_01955 [Brevundimonas sp. Leaf363]|uniref:hypothetical protein n=1 Tax=Brevundimonas sp. Leaf363 TaxID=1736353 RepID=UPI000701F096|nr:hypothetical protein [Brevundimonas sp. Leaf363]KQS57504.1 hypothetical protein ASG17_01955 [Brevundimonas sp. Leaf363]